jgi:hypothetical protein
MSSRHFSRGAFLAIIVALGSVPSGLEAQSAAPTVEYATYVGSNLHDSIVAVETDITGTLHVFGSVPAGATVSFPSLPAPQRFNGTTPRPPGSRDCYLLQRFPGHAGDPRYSYVALISDLERCDAMTVGPGGEVYTAGRVQGGTRIDAYSLAGSDDMFRVTRTFALPVREIEAVVQLRVNSARTIHAVGRCALDPALWPLQGSTVPPSLVGAQSSPEAGLCDGSSSDSSQYLLFVFAVQPTPRVFRTFLGRSAATLDVSAMEIGSNGKVYVAGCTDAGLLETRNAYQPEPGDIG